MIFFLPLIIPVLCHIADNLLCIFTSVNTANFRADESSRLSITFLIVMFNMFKTVYFNLISYSLLCLNGPFRLTLFSSQGVRLDLGRQLSSGLST